MAPQLRGEKKSFLFTRNKMIKIRRRLPTPAVTGKYAYPRVQPGGQSANTIRIKKRRSGVVRGLRSGPGHRALQCLSQPRQFARRSETAPGGWTYDWGAMATLLTALHANTIDLFGLQKFNWNRAAVPYVGAALPTPGSVSANFDHYFRQQVARILPATDMESLSVGALERLAADAQEAPRCAPPPRWHESPARPRRQRSDRNGINRRTTTVELASLFFRLGVAERNAPAANSRQSAPRRSSSGHLLRQHVLPDDVGSSAFCGGKRGRRIR